MLFPKNPRCPESNRANGRKTTEVPNENFYGKILRWVVKAVDGEEIEISSDVTAYNQIKVSGDGTVRFYVASNSSVELRITLLLNTILNTRNDLDSNI
jgi:hypothetical protein